MIEMPSDILREWEDVIADDDDYEILVDVVVSPDGGHTNEYPQRLFFQEFGASFILFSHNEDGGCLEQFASLDEALDALTPGEEDLAGYLFQVATGDDLDYFCCAVRNRGGKVERIPE